MKKLWMFILFSLTALCAFTQMASTSAAASGTVNIPTLQSLKIEKIFVGPVLFDKVEDLTNGKELKAFYKVSVISNLPWLVDVKTFGNSLQTSSPTSASGQEMPTSIISLKGITGYVPLSAVPQTLLISNNNLLQNHYFIDARFNPGWNFSGGEYSTTLMFTLTAQ